MEKKLIVIISLIFLTLSLVSCKSKPKLLLLNWGEYINLDLVKEFEKENNCEVILSLADSNDVFYSKVKSGTTVYDLVIPSEYMVQKMYKKGLLQEIDYKLLGFDTKESYLETFLPGVRGILKELENKNAGLSNYLVPYFWGTWGLMYNKNNQELVKKIEEEKEPWSLLFDKTKLSKETKIGMYDTSRYAYAASMFYQNMSPNSESNEALNLAKEAFREQKFSAWGTDTLKKDIASDNLDLAFMWTGDFLDMLYLNLKTKTLDEINFDILIPQNTIAFCDSFVITKNSRNVKLAHEFIKFFLDKSHAYQNAKIVGYCTPILKAYDNITRFKDNLSSLDTYLELKEQGLIKEAYLYRNNKDYLLYGKYLDNNLEKEFLLDVKKKDLTKIDLKLNEEVYHLDINFLTSWSYAVNKYYPKFVDNEKGFTGIVLSDLSREYVDKINMICNNAKLK